MNKREVDVRKRGYNVNSVRLIDITVHTFLNEEHDLCTKSLKILYTFP